MLWGEDWGDVFGANAPLIGNNAEIAISRYPQCTQEQTRWMALTEVLVTRLQAIENMEAALQPSFYLDPQAVGGIWLDRLGKMLGVSRQGRSDAEMRNLLTAFMLLVYENRRTVPGLIQALESFNGPGTVHYTPAYPMAFVIEVDGVVLGTQQAQDIAEVMRFAVPASYGAGLLEEVTNPFLWTDEQGTLAVTTEGWTDASDPPTVTTGGQWSSLTVF